MAYLVYDGKRIVSAADGGKFVTSFSPTPLVSGVFDFDGSAYVTVQPSSGYTNIMGDRYITWNMWVDQESGYDAYTNVMQFIPASITDSFVSNLDGATLTAVAHNLNSGFKYSLSGFANQVLSIEVQKSAGTINYLKINNVIQSSVGTIFSGGATNLWRFGWGTKNLRNATIWNVKVYNYAWTLLESFPGYPNGNTSAAWKNEIGSTNSTLVNPNNSGTRNLL